jgi:hypothetical protein
MITNLQKNAEFISGLYGRAILFQIPLVLKKKSIFMYSTGKIIGLEFGDTRDVIILVDLFGEELYDLNGEQRLYLNQEETLLLKSGKETLVVSSFFDEDDDTLVSCILLPT